MRFKFMLVLALMLLIPLAACGLRSSEERERVSVRSSVAPVDDWMPLIQNSVGESAWQSNIFEFAPEAFYADAPGLLHSFELAHMVSGFLIRNFPRRMDGVTTYPDFFGGSSICPETGRLYVHIHADSETPAFWLLHFLADFEDYITVHELGRVPRRGIPRNAPSSPSMTAINSH
ncbi:MAG: hypothetical protein FWB91_10025 [Defluviitaleaceae bacterium]|nr:hypothetical protein [Defluviitaleaceae bacterium]